MRIGIDARELTGRATGVGRYLGGLLAEWASADPAPPHEFVLYSPEPIDLPLGNLRFSVRVVPGRPNTAWEQFRLPEAVARDRVDVFFAPAYTAPLGVRAPLVVAIHDISFEAHPEWFRPLEGARRRWLTRRAAGNARAVITISEFSRRELVERLGVADERVHVIPPGVGAAGAPPGAFHPLAPTPGPAAPPSVLFVGSILNRRHVVDLVRACGRVARAHPAVRLDLVGDDRSYPREDVPRAIADQEAGGRIQWHRYVPDAELQQLYASARTFAFLSEYEGLGLTPLEALAWGLPPVVADTPVARESLGEAAIYVDPGDLRAIARAVEQALFDEPTRTRVLAAAPSALARYQWPRAAAETLRVLEGQP